MLPSVDATLRMSMSGRMNRRAFSAGFLLNETGAAPPLPSRGLLEVHSEARAYLSPDVTGVRCQLLACIHKSVYLQGTDPSFYFLLGDFHQMSTGCLLHAYKSTNVLQNENSWETLNGEEVTVSGSYTAGEPLHFLKKIPFKLSKAWCPYTAGFGCAWRSGHAWLQNAMC